MGSKEKLKDLQSQWDSSLKHREHLNKIKVGINQQIPWSRQKKEWEVKEYFSRSNLNLKQPLKAYKSNQSSGDLLLWDSHGKLKTFAKASDLLKLSVIPTCLSLWCLSAGLSWYSELFKAVRHSVQSGKEKRKQRKWDDAWACSRTMFSCWVNLTVQIHSAHKRNNHRDYLSSQKENTAARVLQRKNLLSIKGEAQNIWKCKY